MRKLRSTVAIILSVLMLISVMPITAFAASEGDFNDFPATTSWSYAAMKAAVDNGLINGYPNGTVQPKGLLTRAEMAAIINRAFGAEVEADIAGKFSDVNENDWFYHDAAKAVNMRTFQGDGDGHFNPAAAITRQDAFTVIARALVLQSKHTDNLNVFTDGSTVASYAQAEIAAMIERGYVHGYEDKTIRPMNYITREEFAQIMNNIFSKYVRDGGAVTLGELTGEVILTGKNVYLTNTVIDGDLIVGDGLGNSNLILENVSITGRILFRGGEGHVQFAKTDIAGLVVTNDYNGTVNFLHYSDEEYFTDGVYNTPATFLDRTVEGGSVSGKGAGDHDTRVDGTADAGTGKKKEQETTGGGGFIKPSAPVTTKYAYRIEHYLQNVDDDGYTLADTENGSDTYNTTITAVPKTYEGFECITAGTDLRDRVTKDGNMCIKVYYNRKTVTITYYKADGTVDHTEPTRFGTELNPAEPTEDGYTFAGWVDGNGDPITMPHTVTAEDIENGLEIKPTFTANTYNITFDYNDGETPSKNVTVTFGETVDPADFPADPERDGYTFKGWYIDGDETKPFAATSEMEIANDITVKALWEVKAPTNADYKVEYYFEKIDSADFELDGTYTVNTNGVIGSTVNAEEKTITGFVFDDTNANNVKSGEVLADGTLVLKLHYKRLTADVTIYNADGTPASTEAKKFGAEVTAVEPTKEGYTFTGWVDGNDDPITLPHTVSADDVAAGALDIKPTFTINTYNYKVQYWFQDIYDDEYNMQKLDSYPDKNLSGEYGETPIYDLIDETGFTFDMIVTEPAGTTTIPANNDLVVKVLYKRNTYTVTFEDGEGTTLGTADVKYEAMIPTTAFPADPTPPAGYVFNGWVLKGTTTTVDDTTVVTGAITVEPVFVLAGDVAYTVKHYFEKVDSDEFELDSTKTQNLSGTPGTTATATELSGLTGFTFDASNASNKLSGTVLDDGSLVLEVYYTRNRYTVTFEDGDGNLVDTVSDVKYEATVPASDFPADPTKTGYWFKEWVLEDDTDVVFDDTYSVTEDITVIAVWDEYFTVTFYEDEIDEVHYVDVLKGTSAADLIPILEDAITDADANLAAPSRDGYVTSKALIADIPEYATPFTHKIFGSWYYYPTTDSYVPFTSDTYVTEDTDVYYTFSTAAVTADISTVFGPGAVVTLKTLYSPADRAMEALKDGIYNMINRGTVIAAVDGVIKPKLYSKALVQKVIKVNGADEEIMKVSYSLPIIKILGEAKLREMVEDAVEDMLYDSDEDIRGAILNAFEGMRTNPSHPMWSYVDQLLATVVPDPSKTPAQKRASFTANLEDSDKRFEMAQAITDRFDTFTEEFTDYVISIAAVLTGYDIIIEDFMHSMKYEDTFFVNDDNRFVIMAINKKLGKMKYEEYADIIPATVYKFIDEAFVIAMYNDSVGAFQAECAAAKAIVEGDDPVLAHAGVDVSTGITFTVDPIAAAQMLYDKNFPVLSGKLHSYYYYTQNPYMQALEDLLKVENFVAPASSPLEGSTGYKLLSTNDYYSLLYKIVVLADDAGTWFLDTDNVPAADLEANIELAKTRVLGYVDKLINKLPASLAGKAVKVENKAVKVLEKLIDKRDQYNMSAEKAIDKLIPVGLARVRELALNKAGVDIYEGAVLSIAADNQSVSISNAAMTKRKTFDFSTLSQAVSFGGYTIELRGTVLDVAGKVSFDFATVINKLASIAGTREFAVKVVVDDSSMYGDTYKLILNGKEIGIVTFSMS